jgi:hypothetical protein
MIDGQFFNSAPVIFMCEIKKFFFYSWLEWYFEFELMNWKLFKCAVK